MKGLNCTHGVYDTVVVGLVQSRDAHKLALGGLSSSSASDLELCAVDVKLRASNKGGNVEGDELVTKEVVSRCEVGGDTGGGSFASVDSSLVPGACAHVLDTLLLGFEPPSLGGIEFVAGYIAARSHVSEDRALVVNPLYKRRSKSILIGWQVT